MGEMTPRQRKLALIVADFWQRCKKGITPNAIASEMKLSPVMTLRECREMERRKWVYCDSNLREVHGGLEFSITLTPDAERLLPRIKEVCAQDLAEDLL